MYGAEHGMLLHAAIVVGSWVLFVLLCTAPFLLVFAAYMAWKRARQPISCTEESSMHESR